MMQQKIEACHYWQQIKAETPEVIEQLAADTVLSPEVVDFFGANELLPEVELELDEVPRALDDYELAMTA